MNNYAYVADILDFGRPITAQEQDIAENFISAACAKLRTIAKRYGVDIDVRVTADADYAAVVRETIVKSVIRALDSAADNSPPAVQASQAAMGYSVSMTYLNSGQSLYFLKNELKDLGILRQRWGALEVYGDNENSN